MALVDIINGDAQAAAHAAAGRYLDVVERLNSKTTTNASMNVAALQKFMEENANVHAIEDQAKAANQNPETLAARRLVRLMNARFDEIAIGPGSNMAGVVSALVTAGLITTQIRDGLLALATKATVAQLAGHSSPTVSLREVEEALN